MSIQELETHESECLTALEAATQEFEAGRATADVNALVKLGQTVTSATRNLERASADLANFALVGVYEQVKQAVLKLGEKMLTGADIATLLSKNVSSVTVMIPLSAEGIDPERVSVNTLGKRTVVRSGGGGNGQRAKWEMRNTSSGETLSPRDFLQAHGDVLGEHKDGGPLYERVLAEAARYGLTDYAARAGAKCSPAWEKVEKAG